ncbi:hypothetical protein R3P38DRAFT_2524801 [Favolaschia claudopus]|uniref:Fork-head domain-containing protein n=1 Tax=Favolaschia claudopus TaxID=2862362 RepID=A0AAW0BPG6_9AGAR
MHPHFPSYPGTTTIPHTQVAIPDLETDPYEPALVSCLTNKGVYIPPNSINLGLWCSVIASSSTLFILTFVRLVPLPADDSKPDLPLRLLIALAIYGSPSKALTLGQIYDALISHFSWFRTHNKEGTWKSSVRHSLSRNREFVNLKRTRGRSGIWTLMA